MGVAILLTAVALRKERDKKDRQLEGPKSDSMSTTDSVD